MFEKFSEGSIKAIMLAQEESRRLGFNHLATEHILLGLIAENHGVAATVLKSFDLSLALTRVEVEKIVGHGSEAMTAEIPFTAAVKQLLERSCNEASDLNVTKVETEHLLLGLLSGESHEDHGLTVLRIFGTDLLKLRHAIIMALPRNPNQVENTESNEQDFDASPGSLVTIISRAASDFKNHKERAIRNQDYALAAWLRELETMTKKLQEFNLDVSKINSFLLEDKIENARAGLLDAIETAIRQHRLDVAAHLRKAENLLKEGAKELENFPVQFDSFTQKSIKAIEKAQDEARRTGHNFIGTEQLMLGLIGEESGVAAKALSSLGIRLEDVRNHAEVILGRGNGIVSVVIPFTPRSKRALKLASGEARRLGSEHIDTEHLLLGLLKEGDGVAGRILEIMDIPPDTVSARVYQLLNIDSAPFSNDENNQ